jgi:tetratricopeptide (TPR) repeat protein
MIMKTWMVLIVLIACGLIFAQEQTVTEYMAKADEAFEQNDDSTAVVYYQMAARADTNNCEAQWKAARSHIHLGENLEGQQQESHYMLGEMYARKAVKKCPESADAHLQLAIGVGRLALLRGGKTKVELSKDVKDHAEKAIELNPELDIPYHVLGRWHREVATLSGLLKMFAKVLYGGLPPASVEKSEELFKKAIDLNPDYINHHLELGMTYEELENWSAAAEEYKKVADLPATEDDDPQHKKEAQKRLKKVEKKLD